MSDVEIAPFGENIDDVKTGWVPHYCYHHFLGLNYWLFPFGPLFAWLKPDQLVAGTEMKPRSIRCYNIVSGSSLLGFEYREKLYRKFDMF
jgi:hypothetical protein